MAESEVRSVELVGEGQRSVLLNTPKNFQGGKIALFLNEWKSLTDNSWILDLVEGLILDFDFPVNQTVPPNPIRFNEEEKVLIDSEVDKFLARGIIEACGREKGDFISNIFMRPKPDGSVRIILNLKDLNVALQKIHFKMETLKSVLTLVKPGCFFSTVDLKDAYFSVRISPKSRKFLKFLWRHQLFQFTCLPQGISLAPRYFTKLMKPVLATLRGEGLIIAMYIDDALLIGDSAVDCAWNVHKTVTLLDKVGFTVHPEKSVLKPSQEIQFLGFLINSQEWTIRLTPRKVEGIVSQCKDFLEKSWCTIRKLAELIGKLVAAEPGVPFAPLFTKSLEIEKTESLRENKGNFEALIQLSAGSRECILWWIDNLPFSVKSLSVPKHDFELFSDSSSSGWGGVLGNQKVSGVWDFSERKAHINFLELKASFLSLKSLCSHLSNVHIRIFLDNVVAVTYLEKMGGMKPSLNNLTKQIWLWCIDRNIHISAAHIPGVQNVTADALSRGKFRENTEWQLNPSIFLEIVKQLGEPEVDLFASNINTQLTKYVSYHTDHKAVAINAFKIDWSEFHCCYIFSPFSVLGMVMQKIEHDGAEAIVIAPLWETQPWFPQLLRLLCREPLLLPKHKWTLTLPGRKGKVHPLHRTLQLVACRLSGKAYKIRDFLNEQPRLLQPHGGIRRKDNIIAISKNGASFALRDKLINFKHLLK